MRTFYLFEIKKDILKRYKNNYDSLYSILESIYHNKDVILCYEIFNTIVNPLYRDKISNDIKKKNLCDENYICYNYTHSINNYYLDEYTKMTINNTYIKINSNKNNPSFLNDISNKKNIFVCDFDHHDYFLLDALH